jgi:hypothetical protein
MSGSLLLSKVACDGVVKVRLQCFVVRTVLNDASSLLINIWVASCSMVSLGFFVFDAPLTPRQVIGVNQKCTIQQVETAVANAYRLKSSSFVVKLMDLDGDLIRVKSAVELEYALLNYKTDKVLLHVFTK